MRSPCLDGEEDPGDVVFAISGLPVSEATRQNPNQAPSSRCLLVETAGATAPHATYSSRRVKFRNHGTRALGRKHSEGVSDKRNCRSFGRRHIPRARIPRKRSFARTPGRLAAGGDRGCPSSSASYRVSTSFVQCTLAAKRLQRPGFAATLLAGSARLQVVRHRGHIISLKTWSDPVDLLSTAPAG